MLLYDLSSGPDKCLEDPFCIRISHLLGNNYYYVSCFCVLHGVVKVRKGQEIYVKSRIKARVYTQSFKRAWGEGANSQHVA